MPPGRRVLDADVDLSDSLGDSDDEDIRPKGPWFAKRSFWATLFLGFFLGAFLPSSLLLGPYDDALDAFSGPIIFSHEHYPIAIVAANDSALNSSALSSSLSADGGAASSSADPNRTRAFIALFEDGQRRELCVRRAFAVDGPDSEFYHIKGFPPPAECTVQGLAIERLEPEYNFRRGYTLGYTKNPEDRSRLLPYLRASSDLRLMARDRRVLLDFGASKFSGSTSWFLRVYPLEFSEVHSFEANEGVFDVPELRGENASSTLLQDLSSSSRIKAETPLPLPDSTLERVTVHEGKMVGLMDGPTTVNITRFIREELGLTRNDTVVVKMDLEEAEWEILSEWLTDPEMPYIVDELFLELHYHHPSMEAFRWTSFTHSREEAFQFFNQLRQKGFFVHPWP